METLYSLVKDHKWYKNGFRTNLDTDKSHHRIDKRGRRWIAYKFAPYSNTVRSGPILECVQGMLGDQINAVCLNRKRAESPPMTKHRDSKNSGPSWVLFWGDFEGGGDLCMEDGTVYAGKHTWHGPMDGARTAHWVTPHQHGTRFSAVAFSGPPAPKTR